MIIFIITAIATALLLVYLTNPLMASPTTWKNGINIIIAGAIVTLATYVFLGAPDVPSRAAAFEHADNPRTKIRLAQQEELILLQALSGEPDNTRLLLRLGTLQIESGRPVDAIPHLQRAHDITPKDNDILIALAAAHFTHAIQIARDAKPGANTAALAELNTALKYAPKDHPIRADIQRAISSGQSGH